MLPMPCKDDQGSCCRINRRHVSISLNSRNYRRVARANATVSIMQRQTLKPTISFFDRLDSKFRAVLASVRRAQPSEPNRQKAAAAACSSKIPEKALTQRLNWWGIAGTAASGYK